MLILVLFVLALLFGFGAVFAFAGKVLLVAIILGVFALGTLVMLLRHVFEDHHV